MLLSCWERFLSLNSWYHTILVFFPVILLWYFLSFSLNFSHCSNPGSILKNTFYITVSSHTHSSFPIILYCSLKHVLLSDKLNATCLILIAYFLLLCFKLWGKKTIFHSVTYYLLLVPRKILGTRLKVKVKVTQLCLTLWGPMDYTVHEILQARVLE